MLWNSRSAESNEEGVHVSTTSWVVFDRDVEDVIDALWLQFFKCFTSVTVNKWGTLDHPFAGVHCPVRAGSQNVQLIDYATLGGSRDWMIRSPDRRCLISLTVPVAVFMALSMRNGDSAVPDRLTDWQTNGERMSRPCLFHCPRFHFLYKSSCYI